MNEPMRSFDDRSPARTSGQSRAATPDPLAELARLVGQDDPFRDIFGDAKRAAEPAAPALDDTAWLETALRPSYPTTESEAPAAEPHPAFGYVEPREPVYAGADEDDLQPDMPPRKRSGGFLAAGTLLSLAVIGGIGLFAFRDGMSGDAAPGTPPLIRAEPGPNKTVPVAAETTDTPQHNKLIYDRVGGLEPKAAGKVMSRVEEPVELPAAEPRDASRTLAAPAAAGAAAEPTLRGAPDQTGTAPFPNGSEPRRVRTVLIKPDEVASDAPPIAPPPGPATLPSAQAAARPSAAGTPSAGFERPKGYPFSIVEEEPEVAAAPSSPAPGAASSGSVPVPAARPPQPATTVVRSPTIAPAEPPRAAAAPQQPARPAPASPPQAQTRVAALPPAAQPAPARPAPAATAGGGGGFAVQLTSQRSEQEARAAYTGLQRRFGSLLAPYQPSIQRADLGSRGVFYRVRVAADSREDAVKLCSNLKAQGGDCVVQAN